MSLASVGGSYLDSGASDCPWPRRVCPSTPRSIRELRSQGVESVSAVAEARQEQQKRAGSSPVHIV